MITREGRADVRTYIKTNYVYYQLGTGGDSTNPNATDLDSPIGVRGSVTPIQSSESTIQWKFTIIDSDFLQQTIKEVGIFDATSTGNMLVRVNYEGVGPLKSTDEIEFVIVVEVD